MQTMMRPRDQAGGGRRQHNPQISISDSNHHVTDAISSLYDYGDQQEHQQNHPQQLKDRRQHRPLSFLPSTNEEINRTQAENNVRDGSNRSFAARAPLARAFSYDTPPSHPGVNGDSYQVGRSNSAGTERPHSGNPHSLAGGLRSPADTANASFPLNDIDYESSPAAVAQELSNLQAIRRMSMDVNPAGDPDLPSFSGGFSMPTVAPTGDEDEDDAAKLFWVPASVHPELAPKEFKTFLAGRVESIRRRSGEYSLSPDGPSQSSSATSSLRRKKSMLSRQIDNTSGRGGEGYQDGAERLMRNRSQPGAGRDQSNGGMTNLQELEVLVNDPSEAIKRLSLDTARATQGGEVPIEKDMPLLPAMPGGGNSLRRSTRTTYRRGSLRKGERVPRSARAQRNAESDQEETPTTPISASEQIPLPGIQRIRTEPAPVSHQQPPEKSPEQRPPPENFSRPGRLNRNRVISPGSPPGASPSSDKTFDHMLSRKASSEQHERTNSPPNAQQTPSTASREPKPFVSQIASNGRSTLQMNRVPSIVETPPSEDLRSGSQQSYYSEQQNQPMRGQKREPVRRQTQPSEQNTLQHMASHPSPLPGNSTRTDSLSFIPTLTEDRKSEPKKDAVKKSGWSWGSLLGSEEKEKERRKEEEMKEASKKGKSRLGRPNDNTRLDVLQTTMDGSRGRESLVLNRDDLKLEEERKKESSRKSTESKKEKDGIFSSLFGAGKKKQDRESLGKKSSRNLSPEPPRPALKPDIDYNWTRFSILEERAIYRMAHIKLANPRRALYSQVLLSNFMYSYLAKVQQMHPTMQIPANAAQKAQQRQQLLQQQQQQQQQQQAQRKAEQPEEFSQYQRYQEQQQIQEQQAQQQQQQQQQQQYDSGQYVEDAQNYNYDDSDDRNRPQSRASQHDGNKNGSYSNSHGGYQGQNQRQQQQQQVQYQYQQSQFDEPDRRPEDDMW